MKCCNLIQCIPSGPALVYTASLYLKFLPSRTLRTKSGWHALATVGENLLDDLFLIRFNSKQNLMAIFKKIPPFPLASGYESLVWSSFYSLRVSGYPCWGTKLILCLKHGNRLNGSCIKNVSNQFPEKLP